jgi:hypothetical protein
LERFGFNEEKINEWRKAYEVLWPYLQDHYDKISEMADVDISDQLEDLDAMKERYAKINIAVDKLNRSLDKNQTKKYNLLSSRKYTGTIVGAGGEIENPYICDNIINIEDKIMNQFLLVDLSNIVDSIKRETGITILGIVSLPQMKFIGMNIDTNDNLLILE